MFNTDIHHFLQKADWQLVYYFMEAISSLGTVLMMTLMVYILVTGIEFKRGLWIANIFFYTLLFTILLKETIDFPRPFAVDTSLEVFGAEGGQDLRSALPSGFFEVFSPALLAQYRQVAFGQWGLPSGHTSMITALFLGGAFFFKKRKLTIIAVVVIVLTMLSRMYLAKHFLGDVIGGLILGSAFVLIIWSAYVIFEKSSYAYWALCLFPLLFLFFPVTFSTFQTGTFIGFNMAALLIIKLWGWPIFSSKIMTRAAGVSVFFLLGYLMVYVSQKVTLSEDKLISIILFAFLMCATFLLSALICKKLKIWSFS